MRQSPELANRGKNLSAITELPEQLAAHGIDRTGHRRPQRSLYRCNLCVGQCDAIKARIQQHIDAGADHVCVQPVIRMDSLAICIGNV